MNAADFTFGVEIETHMPRGSVYPGPHGCGVQVPWLPAGWLADEDPSIIPPNNTRIKCEFVSPVLRGADGLRQLCEVITKIKEMGGQVNASCGLHVHVGYDQGNTPAVRRLLNLVANHEKALYAVTGTRSRERGEGSRHGTNWCKSVKQYGNAARAERFASSDRYHLLNLATGGKPTVEFRVFGSSLNAAKAAAYVRLCIGLCQKSLVSKQSAPWNATKRAAVPGRKVWNYGLGEGAGEGAIEAARLLFSLGWKKRGAAATYKVYGVIEGDGVPSINAARKQIARLSKQYDELG
jgi:hypothetical protein